MPTTKTWIILDNDGVGIPVNMEYAMDVEYGGDFPIASDAQKKTIFIYQPVQVIKDPDKYLARYIAFQFNSANLAVAAMARIGEFLTRNGLAEDLRVSRITIAGITPASVTAGVATSVAVTGGIFEDGGKITINAATPVDCVTTFVDGMNITFLTDVTIPAGNYDVEYTTPGGQVAVLPLGITFT